VRTWLAYAATSFVVTLLGAGIATLLVSEPARPAVWFAAVLAWLLQLAAFAALVAARGRDQLFMLAWLGGLAARFVAVGVVAYWLARDPVLSREAALLSLVAFVFVLLLMEPLYLRRGLQAR
jgi:hypothetical protein